MAVDPFKDLAKRYDRHAAVAEETGKRLLERLDGLNFEPGTILESGCASGRQLKALGDRFRHARIVGLDCSGAMLARAGRFKGWWRPRFELVQGNLLHLPLAEGSVDMVYANLTLSWTADLAQALLEMRRVLKPDGLALLSTLGPDTLPDERLRRALLPASLVDVQSLGSALINAGFREPVLDTDWLTTTHSSTPTMLGELQGAGLLAAGDKTGLEAPASGDPVKLPWEIVSASAWAPQPGQPMRSLQGDEVSIPLERIGRRRRS